VFPAVGYRIEALGRSVVISGDTVATPLVVQAAKGADLLVHEAVNADMMRSAAVALDEAGLPTEAARARGVVAYHADILEVADVAHEAGVRHLVLSHLLPAPPNRIAESIFVEGMNERFDGEITLARDGMEFALDPRRSLGSRDLHRAHKRLDLGEHRTNPRDFRKDRGHDDLQRSFPPHLLGQHRHEAICRSIRL